MINIVHLETDLTMACQNSCVACLAYVPMWRARGVWTTTPAQVERDLGTLAPFLHTEAWGALGGEPLLYKPLVEVLQIVRASGIASAIEVWTNGLLVPDQPTAFWRALDRLVVSLYPGKQTEADIQLIRALCAEHGVEYVPKDEVHAPNFRTMLEPTPTDPARTQAKFDHCFFRWFSRSATNGYFFTCCCGPHVPVLIQGQPVGTDGLRIEGCCEADLRAYLERTTPLGACTVCAGRETAVPISWSEEREVGAWLAKSRAASA